MRTFVRTKSGLPALILFGRNEIPGRSRVRAQDFSRSLECRRATGVQRLFAQAERGAKCPFVELSDAALWTSAAAGAAAPTARSACWRPLRRVPAGLERKNSGCLEDAMSNPREPRMTASETELNGASTPQIAVPYAATTAPAALARSCRRKASCMSKRPDVQRSADVAKSQTSSPGRPPLQVADS